MALRRGKGVAIAALALAAVVIAGCGRDDFKNDPRPPLPVEVTVEISDQLIKVSPPGFGAGLANFSIANNSSKEVVFALTGPTDEASEPIAPNDNTVIKVDLKEGPYQAKVVGNDQIKPARLKIGPEGQPATNNLLLP